MTTLFELSAEYKSISDHLCELDLDEQTVIDTLESVGGDLQEKSINVAKFFRNLESDADQLRKAERQFAERRKDIEHRAESLKQYLKNNMEIAGIKRIDCTWFSITLATNPASVIVDDESVIPDDYMREIPASYSPDKKLIKSAMDEGYVVPGCRLVRGTRLEIK